MPLDESLIYGSINVLSKPPAASSRSLQWTTDGQLLLLTESTIYILTPQTGLKVAQQEAPSSLKSKEKGEPLVEWFKTSLPLIETNFHWPKVSLEWATLCIGALDFTWSAMTYSPTSYSNIGSCLIATLTSNQEVHLWNPIEHLYSGEWSKIQDVTQHIRSAISKVIGEELSSVQLALNCQVQALAWSSQPPHATSKLASILALSTRAGTVLLLRMVEGKLRLKHVIKVSSGWVTHVCWTKWESNGDNEKAKLACGLPDGSIVLLNVNQRRKSSTEASTKINVSPEEPAGVDRRNISSLEWINARDGEILVWCKSGTVNLWQEEGKGKWIGGKTFHLQIQMTSTASSNLGQASGIFYLSQYDTIIVGLIDGTFHPIHQVSIQPAILEHARGCDAMSMSSMARSAFLSAEAKEIVKPKDGSSAPKLYLNHVARTTGALACDNGGMVVWLHQKIFAESHEFIPDAKVRCMLIITPLIKASDHGGYVIDEIRSIFDNLNAATHAAPIYILRGVFMHLKRKQFVKYWRDDLLSLLAPSTGLEIEPTFQLPIPIQDNLTLQWKKDAMIEYSDMLWGQSELQRARLKLNIASLCSETCKEDTEFAALVVNLEEQIARGCAEIKLHFLKALPPEYFYGSAILLASRLVQQEISDSTSVQKLVEEVSLLLDSAPLPPESEHCVACNADIPFESENIGTCKNGHIWGRCSATSYILTTPDTRSCVCCGRKMKNISFQEDQELSKEIWLEEILVGATKFSCSICGNRCVKIV